MLFVFLLRAFSDYIEFNERHHSASFEVNNTFSKLALVLNSSQYC